MELSNGDDPAGLVAEMERIRNAERLDILTLTDASGKVFYRTCNPSLVGDDQRGDSFVQYVLQKRSPVSSTDIVQREELLKESQKLADQALMDITPTPNGRSFRKNSNHLRHDDEGRGARLYRRMDGSSECSSAAYC